MTNRKALAVTMTICHYCGEVFLPDQRNEKVEDVRYGMSMATGLHTIYVCDECLAYIDDTRKDENGIRHGL